MTWIPYTKPGGLEGFLLFASILPHTLEVPRMLPRTGQMNPIPEVDVILLPLENCSTDSEISKGRDVKARVVKQPLPICPTD